MATERHMDPAKVRSMGQALETMSTILKVVSTVLEVQMTILKTTAFIGMFGGLVLERYIAQIKPRIDDLAKQTAELSQDAILSAADWEKAQLAG